jgi:hypothetical protein
MSWVSCSLVSFGRSSPWTTECRVEWERKLDSTIYFLQTDFPWEGLLASVWPMSCEPQSLACRCHRKPATLHGTFYSPESALVTARHTTCRGLLLTCGRKSSLSWLEFSFNMLAVWDVFLIYVKDPGNQTWGSLQSCPLDRRNVQKNI